MAASRPFSRVGKNPFVSAMLGGQKEVDAVGLGAPSGQTRQVMFKRAVALTALKRVGDSQFSPSKFDFAIFDPPAECCQPLSGARLSEDGRALTVTVWCINEEQRAHFKRTDQHKRAERKPDGTYDVRVGTIMTGTVAGKHAGLPIMQGHLYEITICEVLRNTYLGVSNVEFAVLDDCVKPFGGGKEAPCVLELAPELTGRVLVMMREAAQSIKPMTALVLAQKGDKSASAAAAAAAAATAATAASEAASADAAAACSDVPPTTTTTTAVATASSGSAKKEESSLKTHDFDPYCRHMLLGASFPVVFMPSEPDGAVRRGKRGLPFVVYGDPEMDPATGTPHVGMKDNKPDLRRDVTFALEFKQFCTPVPGGAAEGDLSVEQCRMEWPDTRPGAIATPPRMLHWYETPRKCLAKVTLWGEHLSAYGMADQKYWLNGVLAAMVIHTPVMAMCYVNKKNPLMHCPPPDELISLSLAATGSGKNRDQSIVSYQFNQNQSVLSLPWLGVVNAGYPMSHAGVVAVLTALSKAPQLKGRFAPNMAQALARKQYEATTPTDRLPESPYDFMCDDTPHGFNVFETKKDLTTDECRSLYSYFAVFNCATKRDGEPPSPGLEFLRALWDDGSDAAQDKTRAVIDQIALQMVTQNGRVTAPPDAVDIFSFPPPPPGQNTVPPRPDFCIFAVSKHWLSATRATPVSVENHIMLEERAYDELYPDRPPATDDYVKRTVEAACPVITAPAPAPVATGQKRAHDDDSATATTKVQRQTDESNDVHNNGAGDFDVDPAAAEAEAASRTATDAATDTVAANQNVLIDPMNM